MKMRETFQNLVKGSSVNETGDAIPILQARVALAEHPYGLAALPEDFIPLMDQLPNRANIKQLTLLNEANYMDPWHQQTYNKEFSSAASALQKTGEVTFFQALRDDPATPQSSGLLRQFLFHEDTHLEPDKDGLFAAAANLEKDGYYVSDYAARDENENNSEHRSLGFLNPDQDHFLLTANYSPIRTAVIARQVGDAMAATPKSMESPYAAQYNSRIDFVNAAVLPDVQQQLVDSLAAPDAVTRESAARLLGYLGDQSHQPALADVAANDSDTKVANTAFDSLLRLDSQDPKQQLGKLWELAAPSSDVRELAIEKMRTMTPTDRAAGNYANILALMDSPDNLPRVAEQISQIQSYSAKDTAFRQAMSLGSDWPNFQKNLALVVMRDNPSLRVPALQSLFGKGTEGVRSIAQEYTNDPVWEVRNTAQQLIRQVDNQTLVERSLQEINRGRTLSIETLNALGLSRSREAIEPLIKASLSGPEETREAATNNLGRFSPNIVKYYARLVRAQIAPGLVSNLKPIMDGRLPVGTGYAG
jgi:HEAT repeat protein